MIIQCQAMLLFKICVALMVQALQGGGDEIKPKKTKKMTKKTFFDALCKAQFYIYTYLLKIESSLIGNLFIWSLMQVY